MFKLPSHIYFHFLFIFVFSQPLYALDIKVSAKAAILLNSKNSKVLYEKNADTSLYPASTTKIATALYALQLKHDALNEKVTAQAEAIGSISSFEKKKRNYQTPAYWIEQGSSHVGIKRGETFLFKDLVYAMLVASGNDAANVIAQHTSGDISRFVEKMNHYLKSIGCRKSNFLNPHGLHHPKHQTCARDLAIMTQKALENPFFRKVVATQTYMRPKTNKQEASPLMQTNQLIKEQSKNYYAKAIGVKTGYTSEAQYTLVAAADDGKRQLIAVVLACKDRDQTFVDVKKMFDKAFSETLEEKTFVHKGLQTWKRELKGSKKPLEVYSKEALVLQFFPSEAPKVRANLSWHELQLPIKKDQVVATLKLYKQDENVASSNEYTIDLYAYQDLQEAFWPRMTKYLLEYSLFVAFLFFGLIYMWFASKK